jgi:hypothetical protein
MKRDMGFLLIIPKLSNIIVKQPNKIMLRLNVIWDGAMKAAME